MNSIAHEISLIAVVSAIACVLPGVFLMLRGVALMSDAISHAILPGIVIMFLLVKQLTCPLLVLGAAAAGFATVMVTERILQTKRLKKDAAIGLVFPLFFSVGIILLSLYARTIHLDVDMVLLGELAFAPLDRLYLFSYDCGPYALWIMGAIAACNALFIVLFYKELTVSTFDPLFAQCLGYRPQAVYYALMMLTSVTAVGAFNVVGSILVVALMLTPPACAFLLTEQLKPLLITSILVAVSAALLGCSLARLADVSLAGSIAAANGLLFLIVLIFAPDKGLLSIVLRRSCICLAQHTISAKPNTKTGYKT